MDIGRISWTPSPSRADRLLLRLQGDMVWALSLLRALARLGGDVLVMRVGEQPLIVTTRGCVVVGSRALPSDVVGQILEQLLPPEWRRALDDVGAVKYEVPTMSELPLERFTVVAISWPELGVEVRRRQQEDSLVPPAADYLWPSSGTLERSQPSWILPKR